MKRLIKAFIHIHAAERAGIIILIGFFIALSGIRQLSRVFSSDQPDKQEIAFLAAWKSFKKSADSMAAIAEKADIQNSSLFLFNPNTLDSEGFRRLGLRDRTVHLLLNWRRKGKRFYKKEDIKPLYTLTEEEYDRIAPFIRCHDEETTNTAKRPVASVELKYMVEINRADSATLVKVNGIGPLLAHRIVERRKSLGGFTDYNQLLEIYTFSDTAFKVLKKRISIDPRQIRKIPLNTVSLDELKAHPYMNFRTAQNIINYREAQKRFESIEQLRQVPLMNEEIYRKIAPYISLE